MLQKKTIYQCSVCYKCYESYEQVKACEKRGQPAYVNFPSGLIYETLRAGTDQNDRGGIVVAIKRLRQDGHAIELECWSAADVNGGFIDSVGGLSPMDALGEPYDVRLDGYHTISPTTAVRRGTLRLARMVSHLRFHGIEPLVWDGRCAMPIGPPCSGSG